MDLVYIVGRNRTVLPIDKINAEGSDISDVIFRESIAAEGAGKDRRIHRLYLSQKIPVEGDQNHILGASQSPQGPPARYLNRTIHLK